MPGQQQDRSYRLTLVHQPQRVNGKTIVAGVTLGWYEFPFLRQEQQSCMQGEWQVR